MRCQAALFLGSCSFMDRITHYTQITHEWSETRVVTDTLRALPGHHGKKQALDFQGPFLCTVPPFVLRSEAMGEGGVLGQVPSSRAACDAKAPKSPDYACVCLLNRAEKTGAGLLAPVSGVGHTICLIQPRRMASKNSALPLVDLTLSSRNSIASRSSIG